MSRLKHQRMRRGTKLSVIIGEWLIKLTPIILIVAFIWSQNNLLINKEYVYKISDLPKSFVGYKVVHISDISNSNIDIAKKVKKAKPDVIVISGGYSDSKGAYSNSVKEINKLAKIAPVYYIYNKEDTDGVLANANATNLTDTTVQLSPNQVDVKTFIENNYGKGIIEKANSGDEKSIQYVEYVTEELKNTANSTIDICGLGLYDYEKGIYDAFDKTLELIGTDASRLSILLNGNIDNLDEICRSDVDVVMFGGTFGTNLISDRYTKGLYGNHGTQLVVSGGVGKHDGVRRMLNFPEIQTLVLSDGTIDSRNPLEKFIGTFFSDVGTIFDNDGGFSEYTYHYGEGVEN